MSLGPRPCCPPDTPAPGPGGQGRPLCSRLLCPPLRSMGPDTFLALPSPGAPGTPTPTSLGLPVPSPSRRPRATIWAPPRLKGLHPDQPRLSHPSGAPWPPLPDPTRAGPPGTGWGCSARGGQTAAAAPTRRAHSLPNSAATRPRAELQATSGRVTQLLVSQSPERVGGLSLQSSLFSSPLLRPGL